MPFGNTRLLPAYSRCSLRLVSYNNAALWERQRVLGLKLELLKREPNMRVFVNKKLGNEDLVAMDNLRIRQLLLGMQDQQSKIESLQSFLLFIDDRIQLESLPQPTSKD